MSVIYQQAETQHGLVTREQAAAVGFDKTAFDAVVRGGRLERLGRGVFRVPGSVPTWQQELLGAVWSAGSGAVASHRSAACLWRLPGFPPGPVEVLRPHRSRPPRGRHIIRHTSFLPADHVTTVDGIPVTGPARTVLDLCGVVHPERAARLLDNALAAELTTLSGLAVVLAESAASGRDGISTLRQLLAERDDGYVPPASDLEALVLAVVRRAGLPEPERQQWLGGNDAPAGRVDFLFRQANLVVEADSRRHHSSWSDQEADRRRDSILMAGGFQVLRVTWKQLMGEPQLFVAAVRAALRRAAA